MQPVVWVPALVALAVAALRGWRAAWVFVALPALLVLPAYYTWKPPGIPVATFHNYLLLVVLGALFLARDAARFRPRALDLLPLALALTAVLSEYEAKGFHDARNLAAMQTMLVVAPWCIGRALAFRDEALLATVAMLVLLGGLVGGSAVFEARLGRNPYDLWRDLWPVHVPWDGALYRAGIRRVAGPFAHPICHGFFFSLVIPLGAWLVGQRLPRERWLRRASLSGLVLGLVCSVSRGPIVGTLLALGVARAGVSRARWVLIATAVLVSPLVGAVVSEKVASIPRSRSEARSETEETAAYRMEMLDNYLAVVREEPIWGYGRYQIPVVKGQKSIDNQYLFLALTHGVPHAALFLSLLILPVLRIVPRLLARPPDGPLEGLGWALCGCLCGSVFTQITVFAGTQTAQLVVLLSGLTVSLADRVIGRPEA